MEKFTKFRDPGTGIAPFLPIAPDSRTPLILPLQLALCVIRVPLLILVLGFEVLFVEVIGELAIRPMLPILTAWLRWIFLRILLFVFGIVAIDEQIDGVSKSLNLPVCYRLIVDKESWRFLQRQAISLRQTLLVLLM